MKKWFKWTLAILGVLALLSLLVGAFDWAAEPVAKVVGKPVEVVKSFARTVAAVAIGVIVCLAAVASIGAAPFIGAVLLAVGVGTIVLSLWPLFSGD